MNLISTRFTKDYRLRLDAKDKTNSGFSWIKKLVIIFLMIAVGSVGYFQLSNVNKAKAVGLGLDNNYDEILVLNERLANVVPVPFDTISTSHANGDKRVVALLIFLEKYKSPMASMSVAKAFVENADKNGFGDNWMLLPAISGIESAFGKLIPRQKNVISYNGWGWSGGSKYGRWSYFESWEDAAAKISAGVARGYGVQNLTPDRIMKTYCPPCARPEAQGKWAKTVNRYMAEMQDIYKSL